MSPIAKQLRDDALCLSFGERAALAAELIESLDSAADDDGQAEWDAEIQRRIEQLDCGEVTPIPWHEARKMITGTMNGPESR